MGCAQPRAESDHYTEQQNETMGGMAAIYGERAPQNNAKRVSIGPPLNVKSAADASQSREYTIGHRKYKYFGMVDSQGRKHGSGQLYVEPENDLWMCEFLNDRAHGQGQIYFGNGDYFEGYIEQDQMKMGKYYRKRGDMYEGPFTNGQPNGLFRITSKDSTTGSTKQIVTQQYIPNGSSQILLGNSFYQQQGPMSGGYVSLPQQAVSSKSIGRTMVNRELVGTNRNSYM